jgi:guanylate kinase
MEQNGIAYNFVSNGVFDTMINEWQFLESAEYAGSKYGTPISAVDSIIQAKEIPLLEIELNGATQARKKLENIGWRVKVIFVMNSTLWQTRERLISRWGQDEEKVNQRMMRASEELSQSWTITDIYILNDVNDAGQSAALAISHIINTSTQKK